MKPILPKGPKPPKPHSRQRHRLPKNKKPQPSQLLTHSVFPSQDPYYYELMNFRKNMTTRQRAKQLKNRVKGEQAKQLREKKPRFYDISCDQKKVSIGGYQGGEMLEREGEETKREEERDYEIGGMGLMQRESTRISIFRGGSDITMESIARLFSKINSSFYLSQEEISKDIQSITGRESSVVEHCQEETKS